MPTLRLAVAEDSPEVIQLIDKVLCEYGDAICLSEGGAEADLLDLPGNYFEPGGVFWVLESFVGGDSERRIVGSHAAVPDPHRSRCATLRRLYLDADYRGTGAADQLMEVAIDWCRRQQFDCIEFWSDTRFERAHRFFQRYGFRRSGEVREMNDGSQPYSEFHFRLDLAR